VLAATFLVFMRLSVRLATLAGGLAAIVSVWIMAWRWQLEPTLLARTALAGVFILVLLNLFLSIKKQILEQRVASDGTGYFRDQQGWAHQDVQRQIL
ncbi:hypothetical protein JZU69_06305, partial [bacterium]|nr:hypothetical protein [bacterium]